MVTSTFLGRMFQALPEGLARLGVTYERNDITVFTESPMSDYWILDAALDQFVPCYLPMISDRRVTFRITDNDLNFWTVCIYPFDL